MGLCRKAGICLCRKAWSMGHLAKGDLRAIKGEVQWLPFRKYGVFGRFSEYEPIGYGEAVELSIDSWLTRYLNNGTGLDE